MIVDSNLDKYCPMCWKKIPILAQRCPYCLAEQQGSGTSITSTLFWTCLICAIIVGIIYITTFHVAFFILMCLFGGFSGFFLILNFISRLF